MVDNWGRAIVDFIYLLAAVLFVFGIWRLGSPKTARLGNNLSMAGLVLAILATFFHEDVNGNYIWILLAMVVGGVPGWYMAKRVQMTAMPQMIAIFNGLGGAAAAFVGVAEALDKVDLGRGTLASIVLGTVIGSITLTGSLVAFGKLQGIIKGVPKLPIDRNLLAMGLIAALVVLTAITISVGSGGAGDTLLIITFIVALVAGYLLVIPIGGADMPVIIAILNAFSGIAGILTGFALNLQPLIVAGTLVGASGLFLSLLMANAMNRSLVNVVFGSFGAAAVKGGPAAGSGEAKPIIETSVEDAAVSLGYASRVIVVPGYGLAVAQAQHAVQELASVLQERGVDVRYAIHPVAGRMPGHMNVLLAEANVPYDDLYEMDAINSDFAKSDVALVIGANDVTNPAARDDPSSPIYGMPILKVDEAERVIVLKRGMSPGFAGVENELFHLSHTSMLFGDAKDSLQKLIGEVRNV
jgi:H+-translocating NAD(P) transhydrogenase subunit beta